MSCFEKEESNLQIFAQLPQELKHKICLYSGHFKLRYDNKTKQQILVAQLNLQTTKWKNFKAILELCILRKEIVNSRSRFRRLEYVLSVLTGIACSF